MNNPRISNKDRNLIKGAIRRVFSRSELRREVLDEAVVEYSDITRPRVKKWIMCAICATVSPKYKAAVDHIDPVVPVNKSLTEMSWDEIVDRVWCSKNNLQALCPICHNKKSKLENTLRRTYKKERASK